MRRTIVLAATVVLALALAGCGALRPSADGPAPTDPDATEPATPRPVVIDCALLLSDADAAGLTPPLAPIASYTPTPGTLGATMAADGARVCGWGTGGAATLEIAAALPASKDLAAAKTAAETGGESLAPAQTDGGFFAVEGGVGRVQLFIGQWWIVISSSAFTESDKGALVSPHVIHDLRTAGG
jgi:hypothetical protein